MIVLVCTKVQAPAYQNPDQLDEWVNTGLWLQQPKIARSLC